MTGLSVYLNHQVSLGTYLNERILPPCKQENEEAKKTLLTSPTLAMVGETKESVTCEQQASKTSNPPASFVVVR